MPRQRRLDIPGVIHHVMARGIERRRIFLDENRQSLVPGTRAKLGAVNLVPGTRAKV